MKKLLALTILAAVALGVTFAAAPAQSEAIWNNGEPLFVAPSL
ncbi:hypothetical protein [Tumebacillus flagellatus]|nr:hypothetical protein [Tumebacillus flagellatus]